MSLFAKIMVVVNLILAVVFLASAGTVLNAMESWKAKHGRDTTELQAEIGNLTRQRDAQTASKEEANGRANASELAKVAAEEKLNVLQNSNVAVMAHNTKLEEQLQTLVNTQQDLQTKNSELQGIIENLRGELARTEGEKRDAKSEVETLLQTVARLEQELADAGEAIAAQEMANTAQATQIDQLNTTLAMYNKHFGPLPGGVAMKPLDAVVQAVDNANDIYILSVGSKDGVQEGYEFTVHRNGEYIATVVVDKVFANHASARTKDGLKRKDAQAGDGASTIL
jgi:predicted RNase H-like nuclease (RuvC/YqgF family)